MHIANIWRRITTTPYARALEAELARERAASAEQGIEVARLRAENRALLNSILGIAGIPPLPATDADLAAIGAPSPDLSVGARPATAGKHDKGVPERATSAHMPAMHNRATLDFDSAASDLANGVTSPSSFAGHGSAVPLLANANDSVRLATPSSGIRTPNRSQPRTRPAPHAAPMRRRSWPQIHRLLEFESAQKDKPAAEPLPPARQ